MSSLIDYDVTPGIAFVLSNYLSTMIFVPGPYSISVSDDGIIK